MDIHSRLWPVWVSTVEANQGCRSCSSLLSRCTLFQSRHFAASPFSPVPPSYFLTENVLTGPICVLPSPGQGVQSASWWSSTLRTPSARSPGWTVSTWQRSLSVSTSRAHPQTRYWKGFTGLLPTLVRWCNASKCWNNDAFVHRGLKGTASCTYRVLSGAVDLSHQAFTLRKPT